MKQSNDALRESHHKFNSRRRALGTTLLAIPLLMVMNVVNAAYNTDNIPELPPLEVKPIWALNGLKAPIPVQVIAPMVTTSMTGTEVRMQFRILKDGTVGNIKSNANLFDLNECNLSALMNSALRHWEFIPATDKSGNPVEVKVALPVMVVEKEESNQDHYASIASTQLILIAAVDR